jgi:ankyrin repeat protein
MASGFRLLIEKGLDCNETDDSGISVLMFSIMRQQFEIARFLLSLHKIDVDHSLSWGQTAFLMASMTMGGHSIVHLMLLHPHCDVNRKNRDGDSALSLAVRYELVETVHVLLMYNERFDCSGGGLAFLSAVYNGNIEMIDVFLMCRGVDLCVCDVDGSNAVHFAILSGKKGMIKRVLGIEGIDVAKESRKYGTPLILATETGSGYAREMLVKRLAESDLSGNSVMRNQVIAISSLLAVLDEVKQE